MRQAADRGEDGLPFCRQNFVAVAFRQGTDDVDFIQLEELEGPAVVGKEGCDIPRSGDLELFLVRNVSDWADVFSAAGLVW